MNSASGSAQKNQLRSWLPLLTSILILWLATGLRFYQLDAQSFWNDEGNSARLSERELRLIIEGTASDIHPPLYYLILRGWRELLGDTEFGLRSFSAFAGILTVAATFTLGHLFAHRHQRRASWAKFTMLALIFLAAINPALIYYSQETRMYALLALLSAVSTIFLWRWLNSESGLRWALAYVITAAAGLYTHYFFPAVLIFQNLVVLIWLYRNFGALLFSPFKLRQKRSFRKTIRGWLGIMALVFLIYLPWLPIFWRQAGGRPSTREPFVQFLWNSYGWLSFGETIDSSAFIFPLGAAIALLLWALLAARRDVVLPVLGTAVPVLFMFAAGTTQPAFYKFLLSAVPFFLIWLASALTTNQRLPVKNWLLIIPLLFFIPYLWGTIISLENLYHNPTYARADYRGMAQRIAKDAHPNAGIILNAPNQWEVFTYYHHDGAPVYALPRGQPDPAILEPELESIAAKHERLYAIFWGDNQRDPQHVVEKWLEANTYKATEEWIGDVRFVVYAVPKRAAQAFEITVNQSFGSKITLLGYSLDAGPYSPSDIVPVSLFWQTAESLDQRYKVFLHLVDENGRLVAQRDSEPGGGLAPTNSWEAGQLIIDNQGLFIPPDLPAGEYSLVVGLYDIADPSTRLPLQDAGGSRDTLTLQTITIR